MYVKPGEVEKEGVGPMNGRMVELSFSDDDIDRVRERYVEHVERVDDLVGRLMDKVEELDLLDTTVIYLLGDHGISLGEHDYLGMATPTSHRESYEIPYLIRHPGGEMAGDDVDWYASTHDVAPTLLSFMGLTIPGKMEGEDLTALFDDVDEDDLPDRPKSITAVGSNIIVRDSRWLMVADREEIERRLYDDDEEADDDDKRYDDVANDEPGMLTELSLDRPGGRRRNPARVRPGRARCGRRRSAATTTTTTTASLTTSTRSTTTSRTTTTSRGTSSSTGGARERGRRAAAGGAGQPAVRVPLREQVAHLRRDDDRLGDVPARHLDREHLDPRAAGRDVDRHRDGHVGHQRLQHRVRDPARLDGAPGGPVRAQALLHPRTHGLHHRLGTVRRGLVGRVADRLPGDPGRRAPASSRRSASRSPCWCSRPSSAAAAWR